MFWKINVLSKSNSKSILHIELENQVNGMNSGHDKTKTCIDIHWKLKTLRACSAYLCSQNIRKQKSTLKGALILLFRIWFVFSDNQMHISWYSLSKHVSYVEAVMRSSIISTHEFKSTYMHMYMYIKLRVLIQFCCKQLLLGNQNHKLYLNWPIYWVHCSRNNDNANDLYIIIMYKFTCIK